MDIRFRPSMTGLAASLALAVACGIFACPTMILAKGKPGGNTTPPNSLVFDDFPTDNIGGDGKGPYYDGKSENVKVSFSNAGHLLFETKDSGRKLVRHMFIDFGGPVTIVDDGGQERTFRSTDDLDAWGVEHDVNMGVGAYNFDMLTMEVGETRHAVNLQMRLFMHFPGQQETSMRIALAPVFQENGLHCPDSDPVSVTYRGDTNGDGLVEWRIETTKLDNDLDGEFDEDPVNDVDDDEDGQIDEDGPEVAGLACVGQREDMIFVPFQFGFTVVVAP